MQIYLTKKLSDLLGVQPEPVEDVQSEGPSLDVWYANVFEVEYDPYLSHRGNSSSLLMVHADSLMSFSMSIPEELSVEHFRSELPDYMIGVFVSYGFNSRQLAYVERMARELTFSKASNSSMLGYLRALAFDHADRIRDESYGHKSQDTLASMFDINRVRRSGLVKQSPVDSVKSIVNQAMRRAI